MHGLLYRVYENLWLKQQLCIFVVVFSDFPEVQLFIFELMDVSLLFDKSSYSEI